MKYVTLGRKGPKVSEIGIGMWQAGGKSWGSDVRDRDCVEAMVRGVGLGMNLVDTAEVYGNGHSEEVVARAIRETGRDHVFVATKVSGDHLRAADVERACRGSLKRLGVQSMDRYDTADAVFQAWNDVIARRVQVMEEQQHDCPWQRELSRREFFRLGNRGN